MTHCPHSLCDLTLVQVGTNCEGLDHRQQNIQHCLIIVVHFNSIVFEEKLFVMQLNGINSLLFDSPRPNKAASIPGGAGANYQPG